MSTSSAYFPSVSILGCGWVGLPLGAYLVGKGYKVKGSTTSTQKLPLLAQEGIQPFLLQLNPSPEGDRLSEFLSSDVLIINVPPKVEAKGPDFHVQQIRSLSAVLSATAVTRIIYLSSTSVYPDLNREVTEAEVLPQPGSNLTLLQAEQLLQDLAPAIQTTVLRCGGLMGYNRMPARYVAGKKGLTTGRIPVNYVHRDDVCCVVEAVIRSNNGPETYNVVAPLHPTREAVCQKNALDFGLEPAEFLHSERPPFKIISSQKLIDQLDYTFRYPNPLTFLYTHP
jgi:nucleoside-diphosphate-sugar epimerase